MENLKIRVTTEQESKEAQELFCELRYDKSKHCKWLIDSCIKFLATDGDFLYCWDDEKFGDTRFESLDHKEITLQELQDMVVFKRETLNDKIASAEVARQESKKIDATLAERQSQYGSFEDVAFVTENIMATLAKVRSNGLQDLPHTHRMALYMIASKMARIVNGDFNHLDGWHDIGGYSKLIEDLIGDGNEI